MRKITALIAFALMLALGSGSLLYAHNHQHINDHATPQGDHDQHPPDHSPISCPVCIALHAPITAIATPPPLLFIECVLTDSLPPTSMGATQCEHRPNICRGPPVR